MIRVMSEPKINFPRDLEDDFKIFARSIHEVFEGTSNLVSHVAKDKEIRFKGRFRPKKAAVLNALLLHVASLSEEEQVRMVRSGMLILNDLLRREVDGGAKESPAEREGGAKRRAEWVDPEKLPDDPKPRKRRPGKAS